MNRRFHQLFVAGGPEHFPVVAVSYGSKTDDDRQIDWMTYKNINDWTDMVKKELLRIGMVVDKPGLISKFRFVFGNSFMYLSMC